MSRTSSSRRRPSASRPSSVPQKPAQKKSVRQKPVPTQPARKQPQTPRERELNTKRRGELAELAFALKAANLGFGVARPFGDSERYDVIVDAREILPHPRAKKRRERSDRVEKDAMGRTVTPRIHRSCHSDPSSSGGDGAAEEPGASPVDLKKKRNARKAFKHPARRQSLEISPFPPDLSPPLWRVQVKCSTQLLEGLYRINSHRRVNGRAVPYLPGEIHFFAAYIIPEDTWYIIPLHATRGRTGLLFRRRRDRRPGLYDAYREAWHLLRPPR